MAEVQTVLIVGVTGRTGTPIAEELLKHPHFRVVGAVRPSSVDKLKELKSRGLESRECDLDSATPDELQSLLRGIDTVILCLIPFGTGSETEKRLIDAAKVTGVKRFIPSNFSTACKPGNMLIHDIKLGVIDYLKKSGVPYTIIDIGWWMHQALPILDPKKAYDDRLMESLQTIYGTGDVKSAVTDVEDIGKYVARIITDSRTINQYVFVWSEEVTQNHAYEVALPLIHRDFQPYRMTKDQMEAVIAAAKASKEPEGVLQRIIMEYPYSIYILGDNTVENAKKAEYGGALDAQELYPDIVPKSLEICAKELYADLK